MIQQQLGVFLLAGDPPPNPTLVFALRQHTKSNFVWTFWAHQLLPPFCRMAPRQKLQRRPRQVLDDPTTTCMALGALDMALHSTKHHLTSLLGMEHCSGTTSAHSSDSQYMHNFKIDMAALQGTTAPCRKTNGCRLQTS